MKVAVLPMLFLRFFIAWTFLWAFFDKLLGLGYATASENAWLSGGSPTKGFLTFGTEDKMFQELFIPLAGHPIIDMFFMLGLLFIGLALLLGIGMRIAGYATVLLTLLMFLAVFPPENNPLTDDHIFYILAGLLLASSDVGERLGLGRKWKKNSLVKKYPILI